jgi:hypothetical protein
MKVTAVPEDAAPLGVGWPGLTPPPGWPGPETRQTAIDDLLQRRAPRRPHLRWVDRALFIWLYRR